MGEIIDNDALLLRIAVGEAEGKDGTKYELCNSMSGTMLIKSAKTGKTFSLGWRDAIKMAVDAGVDEP